MQDSMHAGHYLTGQIFADRSHLPTDRFDERKKNTTVHVQLGR